MLTTVQDTEGSPKIHWRQRKADKGESDRVWQDGVG